MTKVRTRTGNRYELTVGLVTGNSLIDRGKLFKEIDDQLEFRRVDLVVEEGRIIRSGGSINTLKISLTDDPDLKIEMSLIMETLAESIRDKFSPMILQLVTIPKVKIWNYHEWN